MESIERLGASNLRGNNKETCTKKKNGQAGQSSTFGAKGQSTHPLRILMGPLYGKV